MVVIHPATLMKWKMELASNNTRSIIKMLKIKLMIRIYIRFLNNPSVKIHNSV